MNDDQCKARIDATALPAYAASDLPDHELNTGIAEQIPAEAWPKVYEFAAAIVYADEDRNIDEDVVLKAFSEVMGLSDEVVEGIEREATRFFEG
jgi:hypothetical protein